MCVYIYKHTHGRIYVYTYKDYWCVAYPLVKQNSLFILD